MLQAVDAPRPANRILADLRRAFPRQEVEQETFALYLVELADVPLNVLEAAVHDLIRTQEFFPSIRAIRAASAELALALPSPAGALAQVEARISWARTDAGGEAPTVHPTVRQALDLIGGYASFRNADEGAPVRGQFLRLYRELREDAVQDAVRGDRLPTLTQGGTNELARRRPAA